MKPLSRRNTLDPPRSRTPSSGPIGPCMGRREEWASLKVQERWTPVQGKAACYRLLQWRCRLFPAVGTCCFPGVPVYNIFKWWNEKSNHPYSYFSLYIGTVLWICLIDHFTAGSVCYVTSSEQSPTPCQLVLAYAMWIAAAITLRENAKCLRIPQLRWSCLGKDASYR